MMSMAEPSAREEPGETKRRASIFIGGVSKSRFVRQLVFRKWLPEALF
jgi:hypothetical protein